MGLKRNVIGFWAAVGLVVVVSIAAYKSMLPTWIAPGNADKFFHFAMAGVLAYFLDRALKGRASWRGRLAPPLASVLVVVPLGIDEYCQRFSDVRSSSFGDFAADVAGVAVFLLVARRIGAASRSRTAATICAGG